MADNDLLQLFAQKLGKGLESCILPTQVVNHSTGFVSPRLLVGAASQKGNKLCYKLISNNTEINQVKQGLYFSQGKMQKKKQKQ